MPTFHLTIKTPTETLFDGAVDSVRVKTDLGRMEVLDQHATFVGMTRYSKIYLRVDGKEQGFVVRQGTITVDESGKVAVLALFGDKWSEMTVKTMEQYLHYLKEQLENPDQFNEYQKQFLEEQRKALEEGITEEK